jgi:hypothetical protein
MKIPDVKYLTKAAWIVATALALPFSAYAQGATSKDMPRYAGALTFAPNGTLSVGDNISSAVFAYKTGRVQPAQVDPQALPLEVDSVDNRIAPIVHGKIGQIAINGMAVNPITREVYLSVSRAEHLASRSVRSERADGSLFAPPVDRTPSTTVVSRSS